MKYMLLIAGDEKTMNNLPTVGDSGMSAEFGAFHEALVKSGAYLGGERLRPTSAASTVRVRDQKAVVLTGPYAETQEQLGGYYLIDVPDLDAAIADQSVDVALEIAPDFAEAWHGGRAAGVDVVTDSTQRNAEVPVARVRGALEAYSQQVGALRLVARGIDPGVVRPIGVGTRDLASDAAKQSMVLAVFLPYLLLLSGFLGGIYLIVDATAGERERQSLEP